jgi:hypothetical protein
MIKWFYNVYEKVTLKLSGREKGLISIKSVVALHSYLKGGARNAI